MKADSENQPQAKTPQQELTGGSYLNKLISEPAEGGWDYSYPVILTTLREKLIKTGAKVLRHARHITFQLAEVVLPRNLFEANFQKIDRLLLLPEPG